MYIYVRTSDVKEVPYNTKKRPTALVYESNISEKISI